MSQALPAIGIVKDGHPATIQRLFRGFVNRWRTTTNIVGMIEEGDGEACKPNKRRHLVSVGDGSRFRMFQDLGEGSVACRIDPESLLCAGETVRGHIAAGCDLVVLSKFARLEAELRSGLMPALICAVEAGIPVLTSVAAKFDGEWNEFAEGNYVSLSADQQALDDWWCSIRAWPTAPSENGPPRIACESGCRISHIGGVIRPDTKAPSW